MLGFGVSHFGYKPSKSVPLPGALLLCFEHPSRTLRYDMDGRESL